MPIVNHKSKILPARRSAGENRRFKACLCLPIVGVWCLAAMSTCSPQGKLKTQDSKLATVDEVSIFLTGNELGALKPCGCSGGQLGGLDRRSAVFAGVPKQKRLIVDTGGLVQSDSEQELIKFNIIMHAFGLLGYDVVNLTEKDIEIGKNLGLLGSIGSSFNIISSYGRPDVKVPVKFTKRLRMRNGIVAITVAAFDMESSHPEQIAEFFAPYRSSRSVNIAILNRCASAIIGSIARIAPVVDCLVCPAESDEPMVIGDPNKRPLIFSVGRFGRYVSRLQITDGSEKDRLKISFSAIPVTENLPQEKLLIELYKSYQQLVKDSKLLEKLGRFALPNGLKYTGSESCKSCHEYEYEKWSSEPHSRAYATLQSVGSQFDPECVVCHTVGMKYESGFVSQESTAHLKNVGCETCHGPGSEHIRTLGKAKSTEPKSQCLDCHTPEQSSHYAGNEQLYLEKIIHWGEPNACGDVKKEGSQKD